MSSQNEFLHYYGSDKERELVANALKECGFDCTSVASPEELQTSLENRDLEFVILNVNTEDQSSLEIGQKIMETRPDLAICFTVAGLPFAKKQSMRTISKLPVIIEKPLAKKEIQSLVTNLENTQRAALEQTSRVGMSISPINSYEPFSKALKTMYERDLFALAVIENEQLLGIITARTVVANCLGAQDAWEKRQVRDFLEHDFATLQHFPSLEECQDLLQVGKRYAILEYEGQNFALLNLAQVINDRQLESSSMEEAKSLDLDAFIHMSLNNSAPSCILGLDGRIQYSNPSFKKFVQAYANPNSKGKLFGDIFSIGDVKKNQVFLSKVKKLGRSSTVRNRIVLPSGLSLNYVWKAMRLGDKVLLNGSQIVEETKDESDAIKQKIGSYQQLEFGALAEVTSSIAHEINNPLTTLQFKIGALKRKYEKNSYEHEKFTEVESALDQIRDIIKVLRELTKEESEDSRAWHRSKDIVHQATVLCNSKSLRHACSFDQDVQDLEIYCSKTGVLQVLTNLLNNAMDALNDRGEMITIRAFMPKDERIQFRVTNKGQIPEDIYERLFEPFFSTKDSRGSGLGLSICKKIINDNEGEIWCNQESGLVHFCFELKARRLAGGAIR